jgi:hypothetical protein
VKPHEETWRVVDEPHNTWAIVGPDSDVPFAATPDRLRSVTGEAPEADRARARLAAQAPAMARLLLDIEALADDWCTVCLGHLKYDGRDLKEGATVAERNHAPDCRLVAVLRAAGVLE